MAITKYTLSSDALALVGGERIDSFDSGTVESEVAGNFYEDELLALLKDYEWPFARRQALLPQSATTPLEGWEFAYQLPTNFLQLEKIWPELINEWDIFEDQLYLNYDQSPTIDYVFRPDEAKFDAHFVRCFKRKLASVFAVPIRDSVNAAIYQDKKFEEEIGKAKVKAAHQKRTKSLAARSGYALIAVRG